MPRARSEQPRPQAPPPSAADPGALAAIRRALRALGYAEQPLADLMGIEHPAALAEGALVAVRARLAGVRSGTPRALAALARLFLLGDTLPPAQLGRALDSELVAALERARLVRNGAAGVYSPFALYPCRGTFIATDRRFRPLARQPVMYLGGDSYALAYLCPERCQGRALDLCTGSGVQAIVAARAGAERVLGVDTSARALRFARFNAALNEVAKRCRLVRADLDLALRPGERFELVLANPPFVPSPHRGRGQLAYRDAGPRGERVLARLLRALPQRLVRGGLALVVTVIAERCGLEADELVRSWLGPGADLGALWLEFGRQRVEEYALAQVRRAFGDSEQQRARRFARWRRALVRAGVRWLAGGVLCVRPHRGPSPPWVDRVACAPPRGPAPELVLRLLRGAELAHGIVFPDELLERRLRLAADVLLTRSAAAGPGGRLRALACTAHCRGLPLEPARISPGAWALLQALGGAGRPAAAEDAPPPSAELSPPERSAAGAQRPRGAGSERTEAEAAAPPPPLRAALAALGQSAPRLDEVLALCARGVLEPLAAP
ncbi:MAG: hypothetical protein KatS3mg102_1114 [Planctomycetota bacterium]|nr:MAG: hypothetical protein KatS3mg102_1114 [Planctomycetota bacterium]